MPAETDPVVAVETKKWYKSRILLGCLLLVLTSLYQVVSSPGWEWDKAHLLSLIPAVLGSIIAFMRAKMPDLLTGIGFLDKD